MQPTYSHDAKHRKLTLYFQHSVSTYTSIGTTTYFTQYFAPAIFLQLYHQFKKYFSFMKFLQLESPSNNLATSNE